MSFLVFDGGKLRLALFDSQGNHQGDWPAGNFGGPLRNSGTSLQEGYLQYLPNGQYAFRKDCRNHPKKHLDDPESDTIDGSYGTRGAFVLEDVHYGGQTHHGLAVHAGHLHQFTPLPTIHRTMTDVMNPAFVHRQNQTGGPYYRTNGCIRTTEVAMEKIAALAIKDPLTVLKVQHNGWFPAGKEDKKDDASDSLWPRPKEIWERT